MSNTLYAQLVHLAGIVAVSVLVGLGKLDSTTGIAFIAGLVGVALPSPFGRGDGSGGSTAPTA